VPLADICSATNATLLDDLVGGGNGAAGRTSADDNLVIGSRNAAPVVSVLGSYVVSRVPEYLFPPTRTKTELGFATSKNMNVGFCFRLAIGIV